MCPGHTHPPLAAAGAFLLDDSTGIFIWLGRGVPQAFLEDVLQIRGMDGVDCSRLRIFPHGNDDSVRANRLVNALRSQRPALLQCARVTAAKDLAESRFMGMLTEDRAQVPPTRRRSKSRAPAAPRANAAAE